MDPALPDSLDADLYPSDSVHRREIENHFGDGLLRELSPEERSMLGELDLFFVVFTNRSGSTYLTELLHQMGAGIHPRAEIFNHSSVLQWVGKVESASLKARVRRWARLPRELSFTDYFLDRVQTHEKAGRVGFKINIHQLFWFVRHGLHRPFISLRMVNSLREDPLDQAVSYVKAKATGQWHSLMETSSAAPPEYARGDIARVLLRVTMQRNLYSYFRELHRPKSLDVVYEALEADPEKEMGRLAEFLGLRDFDAAAVDLDSIAISPQRDDINAQWKARFIDEFRLD